MTEKERIMQEGVTARKAGEPHTVNPYNPAYNQRAHEWWLLGWTQGFTS